MIGLSATAAVAASWLFPLFFRYNLVDSSGNVVIDASFDMPQFVRSAFVLLTLSAVATVLWLPSVAAGRPRWIRRGVFIVLLLYCGLSLVSVFARYVEYRHDASETAWRAAVRREARGQPAGLWAIYSDPVHSGQLLAAEGIGPWWLSAQWSNRSGKLKTNVNDYRAPLLLELMRQGPRAEAIARRMSREGVVYLVATPDTREPILRLVDAGLLVGLSGAEWIFRLPPAGPVAGHTGAG